jgi:hypothetical protein
MEQAGKGAFHWPPYSSMSADSRGIPSLIKSLTFKGSLRALCELYRSTSETLAHGSACFHLTASTWAKHLPDNSCVSACPLISPEIILICDRRGASYAPPLVPIRAPNPSLQQTAAAPLSQLAGLTRTGSGKQPPRCARGRAMPIVSPACDTARPKCGGSPAGRVSSAWDDAKPLIRW